MLKKLTYLLLCLSFQGFAQNNIGPRLTAMGQNGAVVTDVWSVNANAAGITSISSATVSLNYTKHFFSNDLNTQAAVLVFPFKNNYVGLSFQRYGFSAYNEIKTGFSYAKKFGDEFSAAINVNYHQIKIDNYGTNNGFSIDVGVMYQLNKEITFGAYVSNPSQQKYNNTEVLTSIPASINLGALYKISDKVLITTTVQKDFKSDVDVKLGLEYKMFELISLRGGLSAMPFKQYAGIGFNHNKLVLDMAITYDPYLGYSPQIAVGYAF